MNRVSSEYRLCVTQSEKITWKLDEIMPEATRVRFDRPHLPEALVGIANIPWLEEREKLALNHIRGNAYMNLFAFVEEYIIAQMVRHTEAEMFGDHDAIRALLRVAEEEVKHQQLFQRYCAAFARDFGTPCETLGAAAEVAAVILEHAPAAVMLTTLHLELLTQQHYVECVKDDDALDPLFAHLLKQHWLEESQHARVDALELAKLLEDATPEIAERTLEDYTKILAAFDGLLLRQAAMDVTTLEGFRGRSLDATDREELLRTQHRSYRNNFLVMGLRNRSFAAIVRRHLPSGESVLASQIAVYA